MLHQSIIIIVGWMMMMMVAWSTIILSLSENRFSLFQIDFSFRKKKHSILGNQVSFFFDWFFSGFELWNNNRNGKTNFILTCCVATISFISFVRFCSIIEDAIKKKSFDFQFSQQILSKTKPQINMRCFVAGINAAAAAAGFDSLIFFFYLNGGGGGGLF